MPNRATSALAAERHLHIVPRDAIVSAVEALDQRIDPTSSPVQVGYTEKFVSPFDGESVSWVHRLAGGRRIVVMVPADLDTTAVASAVEVLVDTALAERES